MVLKQWTRLLMASRGLQFDGRTDHPEFPFGRWRQLMNYRDQLEIPSTSPSLCTPRINNTFSLNLLSIVPREVFPRPPELWRIRFVATSFPWVLNPQYSVEGVY